MLPLQPACGSCFNCTGKSGELARHADALTGMDNVGKRPPGAPRIACVFGASGGIGRALCEALAAGGTEVIYAGSRAGQGPDGAGIRPFAFDLKDEASIAAAAETMRADPPELVIAATGVLTLADGTGPERTYKRLDPAAMAEVLALNTIGPALIAKHMLGIMPRGSRLHLCGAFGAGRVDFGQPARRMAFLPGEQGGAQYAAQELRAGNGAHPPRECDCRPASGNGR